MSDTPSSESPPPIDSSSGPPIPPPLDPPPLPPDLSSLLSRLPPTPVPQGLPHFPSTPREQPKQTRETTDERCWISTNQSNARRALGLEPQISMHCYINFRNSLSSLTPVPGHPNAFLARDAPSTLPITPEELADGPGKLKKIVLKSSRTGEKEVELPKYHCEALDGRYWYVAKGRENVERHFKEMGDLGKIEREEGGGKDDMANVNSWRMIRRIKERIEKQKEEDSIPGKREERQVKRALGIIDLNKNSESLTSLSSFYSTSLQRLHAHVLRIYTPLLTSLQVLPATYTDGTQRELLSTIFTRLTDGSAFTLGERMYSSLGKVAGELKERRERRSGGGGPGTGGLGGMPPSSDVGLGGQQPRVPNRGSLPGLPPLGNLSPPPSNPPVEGGNEGAGSGGGEEGKRPRGRGRPPPETVSIGCSIM